jgi:hypothetical protein
MRGRRWVTVSAAVAATSVLLVVACGGAKRTEPAKTLAPAPSGTVAASAAGAAAPAAAATGVAAARPAAPAASAAAGSSSAASGSIPDTAGGAAADLDRKIIRNADVGLVVKDVEAAFSSISSIATGLGGYVAGSNLAQAGDTLRGTVTLRVPASSFDQAMAQIKQLGVKVQRENISSQDVTEEYADLDARVRNLQATADQLRALLETIREKTNNPNDILTVYRELTDINGQIEQAKGRQQYLSKLSELATLSVELIPQEAPAIPRPVVHKGWSVVETVRDAVAVLGGLGRGAATALIWTAVIGLPCAAIAGLLYLVALLARRRWAAARQAP